MNPNNQLFFNNKTSTVITPSNKVLNFEQTNDSILINNSLAWRDGNGAVVYDGELYMMGGWNDQGAFAPNTTTNEVYKSTDYGQTWNSIGAAGWHRRHSFGYEVFKNKIFVFGGDLMYDGNAPKDVWSYTSADGWVQVTSDWGTEAGARLLFSHCTDGSYLYMAGGQTDYGTTPTMFTDIVRSSDGVTWTKCGDLPITDFSCGIMYFKNGYYYITSGGQYNSGGLTNFNNKTYRTKNFVNWTDMGTLPAEMQNMMYANGDVLDDKLVFIAGYKNGVGNQAGIWYSIDGTTWTKSFDQPIVRHASGIAVDNINNYLYIVSGNEAHDIYVVQAVEQFAGIQTETQNLLNRLFPAPSATYRNALDALFISLKSGNNNYSKLDTMRVLAAEHKFHSRIDIMNPSKLRFSISGSPTFTSYRGYTGDGASHISTSFIPSVDCAKATNSNLSQGIYSLTNSGANVGDAGVYTGSGTTASDMTFFTRYADTYSYLGTNWYGEETFGPTTNSDGFILVRRIGTENEAFRNGISLGTTTSNASATLPNKEDLILGVNMDGIPSLRTSRQIALRFIGSGNINVSELTTSIQNFANTLGFKIV